jgi:hypothetical protein
VNESISSLACCCVSSVSFGAFVFCLHSLSGWFSVPGFADLFV